jgi:hypothetical protein
MYALTNILEGFDGIQKNNARIIFIILLICVLLLQLKN